MRILAKKEIKAKETKARWRPNLKTTLKLGLRSWRWSGCGYGLYKFFIVIALLICTIVHWTVLERGPYRNREKGMISYDIGHNLAELCYMDFSLGKRVSIDYPSPNAESLRAELLGLSRDYLFDAEKRKWNTGFSQDQGGMWPNYTPDGIVLFPDELLLGYVGGGGDNPPTHVTINLQRWSVPRILEMGLKFKNSIFVRSGVLCDYFLRDRLARNISSLDGLQGFPIDFIGFKHSPQLEEIDNRDEESYCESPQGNIKWIGLFDLFPIHKKPRVVLSFCLSARSG